MSEPIELNEDQQKKKLLILRNLQEALGVDKLTKQLSTGKNIHIYWGTATTGRPHVGYFVPMQKVADFLHAGLKVTILFADLHAFLDNLKSTWELLENRVIYYEHVIKALLSALNVPLEQLHFIRGTSYQLTEAYTKDLLRLCGLVSQRDALRAGAEVVKQVESPLLSGLLYPLLQALDEQYLKVDGQFGGLDQRKIFILAEEQLPKLKLGKRFHLMNPMVPGLTGSKMSSSEEDSKIDLLDKPDIVNRKIEFASCSQENIAENGILAFFNFVVLPIVHPNPVVLDGKEYSNFEEIQADFLKEKLSEAALKSFLKDFLNGILAKVQQECESAHIQEVIEKGYPKSSKLKGQIDIGEVENGLNQVEISRSNGGTTGFEDFEIINSPKFSEKCKTKQPLKILYRISTKGKVHLGHFTALLHLQRLQLAGHQCSILISDLGGFLDNEKCPWNAMEGRVEYYEQLLKQFMEVIGLKNVEIHRSNGHQFNEDCTLDMYKMVSKVTRDASALVPGNTLATHLCPIYYALDIHYANVDAVLIGKDYRPFAELSQKLCKSLGFPLQAALIAPILNGMDGNKMSSTRPDFHLDPLDTANQIKKKIGGSFCEPGNLKGNIALELAKNVIFPMLKNGETILIERKEEFGGNLSIATFEELESLFKSENVHPSDLKPMVTAKINAIFEPIRKNLSQAQNKLLSSAFPSNKGGKKK